MACSAPSSSPHRRLSELLEEKQEPFLLDVFLLERGYPKKAADLSGVTSAPCWPGSARTHGVLAQVEGVLKSVLGALVVHSKRGRRSGGRKSGWVYGRKSDASGCISTSDQFEVRSVASSGICPGETNVNEAGRRTNGGDAGRRTLEWEDEREAEQDSKQLSPVSVFELRSEDSDSPAHEQFTRKELTTAATPPGHPIQPEAGTLSIRSISQQLLGRSSTTLSASDGRVRNLISWQHLRYEVSLEEEETTTQMIESDSVGTSRKQMGRQLEAEVQEMGVEIAEEIFEELLVSEYFIPCTLRWLMLTN